MMPTNPCARNYHKAKILIETREKRYVRKYDVLKYSIEKGCLNWENLGEVSNNHSSIIFLGGHIPKQRLAIAA